MKKIKVKIYKDPAGQGRYVNKTSQFLQKAQYGMEKKVTEDDIIDTILDELTMDPDPDSIAYKLQGIYGLDYNTAMDKIAEVQDILYKEGTGESKTTVDAFLPETTVDDNRPNRYDYGLNEVSVVDDSNYEGNTGWEDEESMEIDDLAQEDEAALSIEKTGGAIGKRKFVKKLVKGLRKAAEGMQQDESSEASPMDTPIGGRSSFINNFRRGVKDLGNKYYAEEIYSKMQAPPAMQAPMQAEMGMEVTDIENPMHHLKAYTDSVSNIFTQPMNQTHGVGYENIPEAQKGREQRQANRQARNVNKDFNRAFGDMAAGYFGVPGMPNYMQVISPQIMQRPTGNPAGQPGQSGPLIDLEYKKGPWWKGTREWSAKGIPMQMMMGAGAGMNGFGYMPQMQGYNMGSSYGSSRTFPGEVIRTKARVLNAAADPASTVTGGKATAGTKSTEGAIYKHPDATDTYLVMMSDGALIQKIGDPNNPKPDDPVKGSYTPEQAKGIIGKLVPVGSGSTTTNVKLNNNPADNFIAEEWTNPNQSNIDNAYNAWQENYYMPEFSTERGFIPSGDTDIENTLADESKVWSNPYTRDFYNKAYSEYMADPNSNIEDLTLEQQDALNNPSYIVKDKDGYEYSTNQRGNADYIQKDSDLYDRNKYLELNTVPSFTQGAIPQQANGGYVDTSTMDPNTLARFIYGGGDNQSIEPIISYDDNDMQSKNTQDPYYSKGGMFKYQGDISQVSPGTKGSPLTPQELELARKYGINDPGFDIEGTRNTIRSRQREEWIDGQMSGANNSGANRGYPQTGQQGNGAGIRASTPAPGYTWEEWNALPEATRTKIGQSLEDAFNAQTQGGYYPQGNYGYPTAQPLGQQLMDMFSIYKRNPYTGSKTDFTWLSQNGPARTMNGQVWQPPGQQGQTQNQRWAEATDKNGNKKLMPLDQAEREGLSHKEVPAPKGMMGQQNPMQAGYLQDFEYNKGPWWGGNKQTLRVTNRWVDPNNPNGGTQTSGTNTSAFNEGKGPIAFPESNTPTPSTNTGTQQSSTPPVPPAAPTVTPSATVPMNNTPVVDTQERLSRRETLNNALDGNKRSNVREYGSDIIEFNKADKKYEQARADWKNLPGMQENASYDDLKATNTYYDNNVAPAYAEYNQYDKSTEAYAANTSNRDKRRNFRDWKQGVLSEREYGGYVPDYDNLYEFQGLNDSQVDFSGTGPSNPNNTSINNGGINMGQTGPCTEFEVSDPNSPCYDPNYLAQKAASAKPQDFTVDYNINEAKTLNTTGIANIGQGAAFGTKALFDTTDNIYQDDYLAANTTSDNREATNDLDFRGGYSGLNQRIMSKGQGRGSTGFNAVVGNASFVKQGGQAGYSKGGVYDLTQEAIGAILAAGGQIEFI